MKQLSTHTKQVRVSNAVAAGTTVVNTTVIDTQGFGAVRWTALFGAITTGAVTGVKAQQGTLADGSDMADLAGTAIAIADTDDNKFVSLELLAPRERYVRLVVTRATQNAVIDGVLATLFNPRTLPTTADTTQAAAESHLSPAEGAA